MTIALLQINPTVGDLAGNARLILDALRIASASGADLAATPEVGHRLRLRHRLAHADRGEAHLVAQRAAT